MRGARGSALRAGAIAGEEAEREKQDAHSSSEEVE
jgi:hypothetical protein